MSRAIDICYQTTDGNQVDIDIRAPYFPFGCQQTSKTFWSLPIWNQIGVEQLAMLGETDPIYFTGWGMLEQLSHEIQLYDDHIGEIEFDADICASWLSHLVYCYNLLKLETPRMLRRFSQLAESKNANMTMR